MAIVLVIPARYESTRFPGKPLFEINGKALLSHVYHNVVNCIKVDKCIVATDDRRIYNYCKKNDINVEITSKDHKSGTDRVAEVAKNLLEDDIVINIQGDEPLISCIDIGILIDIMSNDKTVEIATLAVKKKYDSIEDENLVKVVKDKNENALYFSRSLIPFIRNKKSITSKDYYLQHVGIYAYRVSTLSKLVALPLSYLETHESLEQLRWLENGYRVKVGLTDSTLIGIDTIDDVEALSIYLNNQSR